MTHYTQADLTMADRHIVEGEAHILRQEELVSALRLRQRPTEEAETLLRLFYDTQAEHLTHRAAIARALEALR
jgi:hypothetical protein